MPLVRERGFLPDLEAIPEDVARRAKILWINYPNNPTAALASREFYDRVVAFARRYGIVVASDLAYSEVHYGGTAPPSFLEVPGAIDCGIEFHSLSKSFNMTGWRVGFAIGNRALVSALATVKTNTDSGTFGAIQAAGIAALALEPKWTDELRQTYGERMRVLCDGLASAGYDVLRPTATLYCLVATPRGMSSIEFAQALLRQSHVVTTPANGFGACGEGYVRLTICADRARLEEAVRRLSRWKP
jgi:LL-diaminopimelate aminotransferase